MTKSFRRTLLVGALPLLLSLNAGGQERDPLRGIDVVTSPMSGGTVYRPRIEPWPVPDILLSPLVTQVGPTKQLFLQVTLSRVNEGVLRPLSLTIDGAPLDLDPILMGHLTMDDSGCTPMATVTLEDEDNLVRRIANARNVEVAYKAPKVRLKATLTPEDLQRFRRMIALYDMETLPSDPHLTEAKYKDGQVIWPLTEGVTNPELIRSSQVQPEFPREARARGKSGEVVLLARILKDGTVGTLRPVVTSTKGCGFEDAAMEAVKQWKYTPAMKDGQPVEADFTVITHFRLIR